MTKEHLVPASFGGVHTIFVCRTCNGRRANSLIDKNFLRFINNDPSLFILHVERSLNTSEWKQMLLQLVDSPKKNNSCIHTTSRQTIQAPNVSSDTIIKTLVRQNVVMEMARRSVPIKGGRAEMVRQYVAMEIARLRVPIKGVQADLVRQCVAREMAQMNVPIQGGRADRARRQANKKRDKKKRRRWISAALH